ncbi:hypothetical protein QVD17_31290 [Tagetes erecta]|uniref:S-protein homolog n=1 Tax=Tagetes erecta TaxID=13708 RepID=A0AAD8K3G3_TARER|nr:hypothetical protein QVD17_31290 [Tagetes erecta]
MSFTAKHSFFIIILNLLILTWGVHSLSKVDRNKFGILDKYDVYITDADVDNLMVHCKSNDDDLGDRELGPNQYFDWRFRMDFLFTTNFNCSFRSMAFDGRELKSKSLVVFDTYIGAINCGPGDLKHCYWLVRNDGFYISKDNKPFPDGWELKRKW